MKKLLGEFKKKLVVTPPPNQFFELVLSLVEKQDISSLKLVSENTYTMGDAQVSIKYFDADAFEEMQISLGYELGKGFTLVLRNYIEHLVVINHEVLGQFYTIEHPVSPDSLLLKGYRARMDAIAESIIAAAKGL